MTADFSLIFEMWRKIGGLISAFERRGALQLAKRFSRKREITVFFHFSS